MDCVPVRFHVVLWFQKAELLQFDHVAKQVH